MAVRQMDTNNVMNGRVQAFEIHQSGSEVIYINKLKTGTINVSEEVKREITELADGQEISEEFGRKVIAELTYDELLEADIAAISNGDYFQVETETGGSAGSGSVLTISGSDYMVAQVDGIKTKITVEKSVATGLPYTIV
jgi:hypothetical protein